MATILSRPQYVNTIADALEFHVFFGSKPYVSIFTSPN